MADETSSEEHALKSSSIMAASREQNDEDPAEAVFRQYDADGSGTICLEEFREMLPKLGIHMTAAKSLRYFRYCDKDGSGGIDYEEFKVLLFACNSNDNPSGFAPTSHLTPKDAFEMFDEDNSGTIDEDEFYFLLKYMGVESDEAARERMFRRFDADKSGRLEYDEFKKAWLLLGNTKQELLDRGINVPKFARKAHLVDVLEKVLQEEEAQEEAAFRHAELWRKRQDDDRRRREAKLAAEEKLRSALDASGQVYVFGSGTVDQFSRPPVEDKDNADFPEEWFEMLYSLWTRRVCSDPEPRKRFSGINVSNSTFALWGRRPEQVALSDSTAFCLCESGQVFAWGGTNHWWHDIEPSSFWQSNSRGDITARSRVLLTSDGDRHRYDGNQRISTNPEATVDDEGRLIIALQYYSCWSPPTSDDDALDFIHQNLLPQIRMDQIRQSLELRGKSSSGSKLEMIEVLVNDILLENRVLGESAHTKLREIDAEICDLRKRKKAKLARRLALQFGEVWRESLSKVQEDEREKKMKSDAAMQELICQSMKESSGKWTYQVEGNLRLVDDSSKSKQERRRHVALAAGACHAGLIDENKDIYTWGIGTAGRLGHNDTRTDGSKCPTLVTDLEGKRIVQLSLGQAHSSAISDEGEVFMWGSTGSGKLGLGKVTSEGYVAVPKRLNIPGCREVRRISCGASHTACIGNAGDLYVWGCGNGGRLGLGRSNMTDHHSPQLVESLLHETFSDVSCGYYQTLAVTKISKVVSDKMKILTGGKLYCAGPANVLGDLSGASFRHFPSLQASSGKGPAHITQVSAGFQHQSCCSDDGELFAWGQNKNGCCGHDVAIDFVPEPSLVHCLYVQPQNIALGKPCRQSSVYENRTANNAVDGNVDGKKSKAIVHTQVDAQAFWEVDLQESATIAKIQLWSCIDESNTPAEEDEFIVKLFPCWLLISQRPFPLHIGGDSLREALEMSHVKVRLTKYKQMSEWLLPNNISGRYVRVQKEDFSSLCFSQVEVYGVFGTNQFVGKVEYAVAGKNATAAVIRAVSNDEREISKAFDGLLSS